MKIFAQRLEELRRELVLRQADLAKAIGVSATTISAWERGEKSPSLNNVLTIAQTFHISVDWLLGLTDRITVKALPPIETMADLFRILLKLAEQKTVTIDADDDNSQGATNKGYACQSDSHWIPYAEIRIWDNKPLADFCKDWRKLRELEMKGALPDGVYEIYIEQKLKEFKNQPIPAPVHFEEDSLPF